MKLVRKVKVKSPMGLHARPAAMIVKMLQGVRSAVQFTYKQDTVNAKSILSILMLAVKKNSGITITIEGDDSEAQQTMDRLVEAFESGFGELH